MKEFIKSFSFAFAGIISCLKTERNMRVHCLIMFLVIICGCVFGISKWEWMICILLFCLVLTLECVNTAIESCVDLASEDYHELAKKAKDIAAGAVLISAIGAAVVGLMIFVPYLKELL